MKEIAIIQVCDFWGVYVNGELAFEDNSPITVKDIIAVLDKKDDGIGVKISYVSMEGTDLEEQVENNGGFPEEWPL
jgi:hypothetical protein